MRSAGLLAGVLVATAVPVVAWGQRIDCGPRGYGRLDDAGTGCVGEGRHPHIVDRHGLPTCGDVPPPAPVVPVPTPPVAVPPRPTPPDSVAVPVHPPAL